MKMAWVLVAALAVVGARAEDKDGWVTILDAKTFKDWKVMPGDAKSKVVDSDTEKKVDAGVGSSRVDLQACKLEYSIVSPK